MELGFAAPWGSTKCLEGFHNIPPTCLKQHSDSQTRGPRHPREAGNGDSRKTAQSSPRSPDPAQDARPCQPPTVQHVCAGGRGRDASPIPSHSRQPPTWERSLACPGRWPGTAPRSGAMLANAAPSLPWRKGFGEGPSWPPFFNAVRAPGGGKDAQGEAQNPRCSGRSLHFLIDCMLNFCHGHGREP